MAIDFGYDASGNGNNWTANNLSSTAGVGNDSLTDTPTSYGTDTGVGGEVRGNYCTLNPLDYKGSAIAASNGNLNLAWTSSNASMASTIGVSSGKWYWEVTIGSFTDRAPDVGIYNRNLTAPIADCVGASAYGYSYYGFDGQKFNNNARSSYGATYTTNDVIGVALDLDAGTLVFYKNGSSQGTAFSSLPSSVWVAASGNGSPSTAAVTYNFGQRAFAYTAPSGFKALCTTNLPTPTIGATSTTQANDYFNVVLWTGDTSLSRNITGWDFNLGLLWVKQRSTVRDNWLVDRVRGAQIGLVSNTTAAEATDATATNAFVDSTSPNANGFTAGNGSAVWGGVNSNGGTYVGWGWNAGGSNATNTSGTITSTVRANTTSGFSVVTASASGTSPVTVGHGLGVAPSMVIGRVRNNTATWYVYHSSFSAQDYLVLNSTAAKATSSNIWDVAPTSTVFTIGNPQNGWNGGTAGSYNYVAYCFAAVAGYSAFGSYTGNGSTDGPFVYTGFRPRYLLVKSAGTAGTSWGIYDSSRNLYNVTNAALYTDLANAESTSYDIDFLSNGFKIRATTTNLNGNGVTLIFAAFAESPFKYALAR